MEHFRHNGVLYQSDVLHLSRGDDSVAELHDMSSPGRELAILRIGPDHEILESASEVPLAVFEWWLLSLNDLRSRVRSERVQE